MFYSTICLAINIFVISRLEAAHYTGYIKIGSRLFNLNLDIISESSAFFIQYTIDDSINTIVVNQPNSNDFETKYDNHQDGLTDSILAYLYWLQLKSKFTNIIDTSTFLIEVNDDSIISCESRNPLEISDFFWAQIKLVYVLRDSAINHLDAKLLLDKPDKFNLLSIQLFSLEEWLNGFSDMVLLSLTREISNEERGLLW